MPFAFNPVTGDLDLVQDVTGYVEKAGDTMTGTLNTQNLLPATTATYSLGDASKYYTDVFASRYYLNATAYLDGGVAGVIGATGNLTVAGNTQTRRLILSTGTTTDGIYGDVASGIVRLSGGTLNDGAVMLLGGSTHGSIANTGLLRVGATNIAQWTTAGFSPGTDSARTLGSSSLYWSNTYTDQIHLNSTARINGSLPGILDVIGDVKMAGGITFSSGNAFNSGAEEISSIAVGDIDIMSRGKINMYLDSNANGGADAFDIYSNGNSTLISRISADLDSYINLGQNFGIGNTSPSQALDVTGNIAVSGTVNVAGDSIKIATAKTPSSASDTGTTGQIAWDANYIYVCTATDTWKRTAIATW